MKKLVACTMFMFGLLASPVQASSGWTAEAKLYDKSGREKMSTGWLFAPKKTREECERELMKRQADADKRGERLLGFCSKV